MPEESKAAPITFSSRIWELPPLNLRPFSNQRARPCWPKAALMLAGHLPGEGEQHDELRRKLLLSRLPSSACFTSWGKDVRRWIGQCADLVARTGELENLNIREQSFAGRLIYHAPATVVEKLRKWEVANAQSVFSRALGIATLFREVPTVEELSETFLMHDHSFADHLLVLRAAPPGIYRSQLGAFRL